METSLEIISRLLPNLTLGELKAVEKACWDKHYTLQQIENKKVANIVKEASAGH